MSTRPLREVNAPYTVDPADESIGRDTVIIRRNGEPVAAVIPFAEYQELLARRSSGVVPSDPAFARNRAAFQRLLPELLREHRGEWVAIVDEKPVHFGPDFSSVITAVRERFGLRPAYVQEVLERPRIYKVDSPRVVRR